MAVPSHPAQSSMAELLVPLSHVQHPTSRHTAGPCQHQASCSSLITNPTQMLYLPKEPEVMLAALPRKPAFQNG